MNNKKVIASLLLTLTLAMACAIPGFAATKYRLKIGTTGNETHPSTLALNDVKKFVESKTNKQLEVSLYLNSSLGADRQLAEGMQIGTIEGGIIGSSIMASFEPKFNAFELPFLFKNENIAFKAIDGELGNFLKDGALKQGLRIIGYGVNGYRHISNNRGPITKPDDLKGLKIRCMENPVHVAMFKKLGANPTPMSFSELYTALAQKTVDAEENPINIVHTSKFYEVQKYYSLTGHLYAVVPLVVSENWFQTLPSNMQQVVLEAGKLYAKSEREHNKQQEQRMLKDMEKKGMKINYISDSQKESFIKATRPIYKEFEGKIGKDVVELALDVNN